MMNKKILAGKVLKISPYRVRFEESALADIQKAITRSDIRGLIAIGKIYVSGENEQSHFHARERALQRRKGRRKGRGSKKGTKFSILSKKDQWMNRVRVQRVFLSELREKKLVNLTNYHLLYQKVKGGYFRNKRHIKLYLTEHHLIQNQKK